MIYMRSMICAFSLLVCATTQAAAVETVRIFHNDANPVKIDTMLHEEAELIIHNLDAKKKVTSALNRKVLALVKGRVNMRNAMDVHQQAFSKFQNSDAWAVMYSAFDKAGDNVVMAIQYQIRKIPAIIFDDNSVVYGVTSLAEAVQIYKNRRVAK